MRIVYFLPLLLIFSINLSGMEIESLSDQKITSDANDILGLTVGEVAQVLYEQSNINRNLVTKNFDDISLVIGLSVSIIAIICGTVFAAVACPDTFNPSNCIITCQHGASGSCTTNCQEASGLCITGLSFLATPIVSSAIWAIGRGIIYIKHPPSEDVKQQFKRDRNDKMNITDQDVMTIAPILAISKPELLKKLNVSQALALAKGNMKDFKKLLIEEKFSDHINILGTRLIKMIDANINELVEALNYQSTIKLFKDEPILLQTFVQLLPHEKLNDNNVKQGLSNALKFAVNNERLNYQDALIEITKGKSIANYRLKKVVVDNIEPKTNNIVKLITACGNSWVNKDNLIKVSDYFKGTFSQNPLLLTIDLKEHSPEQIAILVKAANNEKIDYDNQNLWPILEAAGYFQIKDLILECDRFFMDQDIPEFLLEKMNDYDDKESKFSNCLKFCQRFGLHKSERNLLITLADRLNKLTIDDLITLADLILISHSELDYLRTRFDYENFRKKLLDSEFLKWAWPQVKNFNFLKDIIIDFCADKNNQIIIHRAWLIMPNDLAIN